MKLTYYGHSCFKVEIKGKHILFDPFITENEFAKHIDINTIEADYIFLTHGHFDHILDAEAIALRTNAKIVANWEVATWFNKRGITEVETNPELIENTSIQAFWKNYESELHKKRSTFTKDI